MPNATNSSTTLEIPFFYFRPSQPHLWESRSIIVNVNLTSTPIPYHVSLYTSQVLLVNQLQHAMSNHDKHPTIEFYKRVSRWNLDVLSELVFRDKVFLFLDATFTNIGYQVVLTHLPSKQKCKGFLP